MTQDHVTAIPVTDTRQTPGRAAFWVGWVLTVLPAAMLIMGGVMDLLKPPFVVEGLQRAGYPERVIVPLGVVTIACGLLFLIPQTAVLGALLLTGYLGGAVATHVRVGDPLLSTGLVPVYVAIVLWLGLLLREPRLRAVLPLRRP
jgi:hypothetical protein